MLNPFISVFSKLLLIKPKYPDYKENKENSLLLNY